MNWSSLLELSFWIPLLAAGVRIATPFIFVSLGEAVSERAGVLNVGIEGTMALGAIVGFLFAYWTGSSWAGLLAGAAAGLAASVAFGILTIFRGADQIVSGIVMNILLLGLASFIYASVFSSAHVVVQLPSMPVFRVPWLSDLPVIGRPFFAQSPIVYTVYALIPMFWVLLEYSQWGLSIRAAGENPEAVDSAGINVWYLRLQAVAVCGTTAGIAGAILAVVQVGAYVDGMIAGRGFIALAIVVFGSWRPWRVAAAALLFGVVDAFQLRLQVSGTAIPSPFLIGMPYILTIIVVALVAHRAGYPAAINKPYPLRHVSRAARKSMPETVVARHHPLPREHS
jgi:ABC-type uncharacterized transport system permease subunit